MMLVLKRLLRRLLGNLVLTSVQKKKVGGDSHSSIQLIYLFNSWLGLIV